MLSTCVPTGVSPSTPTPTTPEVPFGCGRFAAALGLGARSPRPLLLVPPSHPLRDEVEACIRGVYERAFGARQLTFSTTLIAWMGANGRPLCAAGLRCADDGFFSEAYLDAPIEWLLSARTGAAVARDAIFEVTMLASRRAEASSGFLRRIALLGRQAGFEWSFFTATTQLRKLLSGLGIPTVELAPADPRRLPDADRWGSYYAHAPEVCAVSDGWLDGTIEARPEVSPHA